MNLDGFILQRLAKELEEALCTGQITKIYQLDSRSLYFRIHVGCQQHHLILSLKKTPILYLAPTAPVTPDTPTGLAMLLRKYLENGRIGAIRQLDKDRIIVLDIDVMGADGKLVTRRIYCELMGKHSNFIFTENGIILDALIRHQQDTATSRFIAPKTTYELPPNHARMDFTAFSITELEEILLHAAVSDNTEIPIHTAIPKLFHSIPSYLVEELCHRANLDGSQPLCRENVSLCANTLCMLGKEITAETVPAYLYHKNGKSFLSPIRLTFASEIPKEIPVLLQFFAAAGENGSQISQEQEPLLHLVKQHIKKCRRKIANIQKDLTETAAMDTCRLYGDLLMAHAYMDCHYKKEITVTNLFSETQEAVTIPLTPEISLTDNANRYYRKYTKLRNRIQTSDTLIQDAERTLSYLQSVEYSLTLPLKKEEIYSIRQELADMRILSQKNTHPKPVKNTMHMVYTKDGYTIWVGKNNQQNEMLSLKKAHPYDLWFHAKNIPGSHVILRCHDQEPTTEILTAAAQLAAYYSKGKNSPKVEVDSVLCRQLRKPAGSPPGFVVYENQKTYLVQPAAL